MNDSVPAPAMKELSALLSSRMGLHFPPERWSDLDRGLRAAAAEMGCKGAEECARALLAARLSREQMDALAAHLTIGETYFLRDPKVFEALEHKILPEVIRERAGGEQRLKVWSAGCCTGEEAYSLAITLSKVLPQSAQWDVSVLATDINPRFLAKAAAGLFTKWSFRNVPEEWRKRYFTECGTKYFEILPKYKEMVKFSYLNLVEDDYPSSATNTDAVNLIFCRNVLMYFSPEQARRVARKLERSLVAGGWLVTSPSETSREVFASMTQVTLPGALFYRKGAPRAGDLLSLPPPAPVFPAPPPARAKIEPSPPALPKVRLSEKPLPPALPSPAAAAPDSHTMAAQARTAADAGRLEEALEWCEKAIASDKLHAQPYYLLGTIQQERGAAEEAARAFQRAIYLDPDFVLAHFALGNVLRGQGRSEASQKSFHNARELLKGFKADELLPESTEITAGRLAEILQFMRNVNP